MQHPHPNSTFQGGKYIIEKVLGVHVVIFF